jgi:polysaccharide chain length determinant protein (PEP-CTERM system associated)
MIGQRELKVEDYWQILRRRLWIILVPAILGPIVAVAITFFLHERYKSTTLVLVEDQKVPDSVVKSVVTDDLNIRLSTMEEQILSRTRLQPIIEKFGLFKDEQNKVPMEDLVDRLRSNIEISPVRAMSGTRPGGLPGFYINVTLDKAQVAQQVCAQVTSMFTAQNLADRQRNAQDTTAFIQTQLDDAQRDLNEKDAKLAAFKAQHIGQLPPETQSNMNVMAGLTTQLDGVNQAINRAQTEKALFNSMLTQALATAQTSEQKGDPDLLPKQLQDLQTQLSVAQSKYTDDHPDVKSLKARIADVQKRIDSGDAPTGDKPLDSADKSDKAAGKTGDKPETATASTDKAASKPVKASLPETPQIQQLRQQVFLADQTIKQKAKEQTDLQQRIHMYEGRIQLAPTVEQQFTELSRDYATSVANYNDLLKKRNDAQMSNALEQRQQGETFNVMDPANLPEKPSFPNRWIFAGGGLAGGLAIGFGVVLMLELSDKAIRTDRDVESLLGLRTLAMVPVIGEEAKPGARNTKTVKVKKRAKPQQQPVGA